MSQPLINFHLLVNTGEAVQARCLSALKQERVEASKKLEGPKDFPKSSSEFIDQVKKVGECFRLRNILYICCIFVLACLIRIC